MKAYDLRCTSCDNVWEMFGKEEDIKDEKCPKCQGQAEKGAVGTKHYTIKGNNSASTPRNRRR